MAMGGPVRPCRNEGTRSLRVTGRQDDRALDHVLQLAHVAGPRPTAQHLHRWAVVAAELPRGHGWMPPFTAMFLQADFFQPLAESKRRDVRQLTPARLVP